MQPEALQAIGSLWPLAAVVGAFILAVIERRPLGDLISRLSHLAYRRTPAGHEFELESHTTAPSSTLMSPVDSPPEDSPSEIEETPRDIGPELEGYDSAYSAMMDAAIAHDLSALKETFEASYSAPLSDEQRARLEVSYYHLRCLLGDLKAMDALRRLTNDQSVAARALSALGSCLAYAKDYSGAAAEFRQAAAVSESAGERASALSNEYENEYRATRDASWALAAARAADAFEDAEDKVRLLRAAADIFKRASDPEKRALMLEKALEHLPGDTDLLFSAAHAYSEAGFRELALFHYTTELDFDPKSVEAANNLAVALQELDMPLRAVKFYLRAKAGGNTLANANLAYKLIDAGFETEARAMIEEGQAADSPHENLSHAASSLESKLAREKEMRDAAVSTGGVFRDFMREYADALLMIDAAPSLAGTWTGWNAAESLVLTVDGDEVGGVSEVSPEVAYRVKGKCVNGAARVTVERGKYSDFWKRFEYSKLSTVLLALDASRDRLVLLGVPGSEPKSETILMRAAE